MNLRDFIKAFTSSCRVVCTEDAQKNLEESKEIDFLAFDNQQTEAIINFLHNHNVTITAVSEHKLLAVVCIKGYIYKLDIALDIQYTALLFYRINLSQKLQQVIFHEPGLLDFLQVVLFLRNEPRHHQRIIDNYDKYQKYLFDDEYISPCLFRNNALTSQELHALVNRRFTTLLNTLKTRHVFGLFVYGIRRRIPRFRFGKVTSLLGVDGAGKSTIISILAKSLDVEVVYMGDGLFRMQPFYSWLGRRFGVFGTRIGYLCQYIEMWFRYFKIKIIQLRGKNILADRWPGYNRHLVLKKDKFQLSQFLFSFIPSPTIFIWLYGEPDEILRRKRELTRVQICDYQDAIYNSLSNGKNYIKIENSNLDDTVNEILYSLFSVIKK